jgi:hypothetical protein
MRKGDGKGDMREAVAATHVSRDEISCDFTEGYRGDSRVTRA